MAWGSLASTVMAPRSARSCMRRRIVAAVRGAPSAPLVRATARLRHAPQPLHLRLREAAALPRLESAEAQRTERHTLELDHPVPHCLEHPADLALAALADRDLDHAGGRLAHLRRKRASVLELHPLPQRLERPR